MFKSLIYFCFLVAPAVASAQVQLEAENTGDGSTVIFRAKEEVLKATDPMALRQVSKTHCFNGPENDRSLGEIFSELTSNRGSKKRVVLQITRIPTSDVQCASLWFYYTE